MLPFSKQKLAAHDARSYQNNKKPKSRVLMLTSHVLQKHFVVIAPSNAMDFCVVLRSSVRNSSFHKFHGAW